MPTAANRFRKINDQFSSSGIVILTIMRATQQMTSCRQEES